MEKGWYVPKIRGGKVSHFFNSKGRSRCGHVKITDNKFRSEDPGMYRCQSCRTWLEAYGEDDERE